jgi:glycosyltransferase involved in cell wall biosynthesis
MSRPIRFLQVTTFYPPHNFGGDGLYVHRLSQALAGRGHVVDVVHSVDAYRLFAKTEPATELRSHPNITVHPLRSRFGRLAPAIAHQTGHPLLSRAALARLVGRSIDVVHFHNVSLFGPGVLRLGGDRPLVKVYTTHEHWLVCPTHVLWKFNREPCERPTCLPCVIAAGRPPQAWRYTNLVERAARHVDAFLTPSRFTARMHAERGFARPLTHLPPFSPRADADWQHPAAPPHPRPYFLFVGRLEPIKGLETLTAIWDRVDGPDLVIVGDGSGRAAADAAATRNPRISVRGAVPPGQLGPYFVHALATLVPSVTYEVAPTVVLESFARKTPVVARDLGGTSEFVAESGGGLLFRTDDELLSALGRVARDPALAARMGECGYEAFVCRWTEDAHLDAYLTLVEDLAVRKFGRAPWRVAPDGGIPRGAARSDEGDGRP